MLAGTVRASASWFIGLVTILISAALVCAQDQTAPSQVPPGAVPQGTVFMIQLADRLDTRSVKAGDHFHARLAEDLVTAAGLTLPTGAKITGHVSAVEPGLNRRLLLSFDEIQTQHGWVPLIATVTGVPGEHGLKQLGEEGEIGRKGPDKEEIAEAVIVGAGEGAAEGSHSGRKHGTAAGAGSGAANGALSAFEAGHDLVLEKRTALEIRLDRNLLVPGR